MSVVIETGCGRVEGVSEDGLQIFRGIPFARPPTGPRRFRAPEPPEPWSGVRDASRYGDSAPQSKVQFDLMPGLDVGSQDEDCLFLNVFTPAADAGRRPVLVWIHGGAFIIGSGSQAIYDVRPLAQRGDVVVVTLNYRLGALGFLHLPEPLDGASCAGILDQVAALEWVRENASAFGGDPGNVTIFGESAGGMSVGTLLGMPAARGLFRRAIAQSGAAHGVNLTERAERVTADFLSELELGADDVERLWEQPVEALLAAQQRVSLGLEGTAALRAFLPVVDGRNLPEPPIDAIRAGLARDVDVIVGATRDEWKLFGFMDPQAGKLDAAALLERMETRLPGQGARLVDAYRSAHEARASLTGWERRGSADPPDLFFALETDRVFRMPAVRLAEVQSEKRPQTWAYLVTWESPLMDGALGACHGIDVPFVFGAIGTKGADLFAGGGPDAQRLSDAMMEAWLAFARCGDPSHEALPPWPRYDTSRRATMLFDRECTVADAPFEAERIAWEGVL